MDVVSLCPLRCTGLVWRPSTGGFALSIICKGTYDLRPGELRLSEEQEDPVEQDDFWDDDANKSVRAPGDIVPFKPRADVVLVGQAFAPNKMAVRMLVARLSIAGVDKSVEVQGDRTRAPDGAVREGPPFTSMQLRYERAAAGPDNPVGMRADARGTGPLPNLVLPARRGVAAGFGPIAPAWPPRRGKLGAHASSFPPRRYQDQPLPEDLDASFFNVAPADQQAERLEPGERLALENLSPQHPRLVAELPRTRPRAFVDRGAGIEEVSLVCDTLWIDTDRSVCTLTWRGQIGLHGPTDEGRVSILLEAPARPLTWPEIQAHCVVRRPPIDDGETVGDRGEGTRQYVLPGRGGPQADAALPFVQNAQPEPAAPREQATARPPWLEANRPAPAALGDLNETMMPGAMRVEARWREEPPRPAAVAPPISPPISPPHLARPVAAQPAPEAPRFGSTPTVGQASPAPLAAPSLTVGQSVAPLVAPSLTVGQAAAAPVEPGSPPAPLAASSATVLAASNLAAAQPPADTGKASAPDAAPVAARNDLAWGSASSDIVDLLWFDPAVVPRVRSARPWFTIVARSRKIPDEPEDDDPPEDPPELIDRRDVLTVLTQADPTALEDLDACVGGATTASGAFEAPLVTMRGELELTFEDIDALKATLAAVSPFAGGPDKRLKDAVDAATEALKAPHFPTSGRPVEALTTRLRDAFAQTTSGLGPGYLDQQVERALVTERRYQRRAVLGGTWLRALLGPRGTAVPLYLPAELADKLPLYARFSARVVVEVELQQDPLEVQPYALRCLALARAVPLRAAPRRPPPTRA